MNRLELQDKDERWKLQEIRIDKQNIESIRIVIKIPSLGKLRSFKSQPLAYGSISLATNSNLKTTNKGRWCKIKCCLNNFIP